MSPCLSLAQRSRHTLVIASPRFDGLLGAAPNDAKPIIRERSSLGSLLSEKCQSGHNVARRGADQKESALRTRATTPFPSYKQRLRILWFAPGRQRYCLHLVKWLVALGACVLIGLRHPGVGVLHAGGVDAPLEGAHPDP
jgi:hypothetical protein